jgi:hypothetical protein
MQSYIKIKLYLIGAGLLFVPNLYGQLNDSLTHPMNKNTFSINVNYIYNYSSNKNEQSNTYLTGTPFNYNPTYGIDTVYFEKHKYIDASTYDLNLTYNKRITKKLSFTFGLGLNQKKQITKYTIFDDRNPNKSDLKNTTFTKYSIFIPLSINFYYKKWIFSFGNSYNYHVSREAINTYQDQSTKNYHYSYSAFNIYAHESVSYQILKNKGFYLKISAEQSGRFYRGYGYNWFMIGASYYF